jgi:hypothetical protein
VTLEAKAVRPGEVTFVVHNGGELVHGFEMKIEEIGSSDDFGDNDRFEREAPTFNPEKRSAFAPTLSPASMKLNATWPITTSSGCAHC